MKTWFEKAANKIHEKERKSFNKEMLKKSEKYDNEVKNSEYDNIHDYENSITNGCVKRLFYLIAIITIVITILILL